MFDCSKDIRAYHDQQVTLPGPERDAMRRRRNSNRDRLRGGLDKGGKPKPIQFVAQGSYAMKTMVCDPNNDYDIDDGVYFKKEHLVGPRRAEMTSLQAREMVCNAVGASGGFKHPPEVRNNCVRVNYQAGYHVDLPVYRRVETSTGFSRTFHHELAAGSGWKRSEAKEVARWYESERSTSGDGQQLRRINRILKKYARSRPSWRSGILSGFGISVLVIERFRPNVRVDRALYETMVSIRDRLDFSLVIAHPTTPGDYITNGFDDARARSFRDKLTYAIDSLQPLFWANCTRQQALQCWDKVFATEFFSERYEDEQSSLVTAPGLIGSGSLLGGTSAAADAVSSAGGGRYA